MRAVRPLPDVRGRGVPVDLTRHGGTIIIITRSEAESTIARTNGSRRQANTSGDIAARRLPLYVRMQGQVNFPLNEPPDPGEQPRRNGYR